ncbi:MAG: PhoH family protein, partial [Streptococcus sp.]|nr:PhoH family protein [Streptococcus sp.]
MQEHSVEITLSHPDDVLALFGSNERHLKLIEDNLGVIIHARTERVQILGDDKESVELARVTIQALLVLVSRGMLVNTSDVVTALSMAQNGSIDKFVALYEEEIIKDNSGKPIRVKTLGQKVYADSVKSHDVVFGIGPAGTGKTFLETAKVGDRVQFIIGMYESLSGERPNIKQLSAGNCYVLREGRLTNRNWNEDYNNKNYPRTGFG